MGSKIQVHMGSDGQAHSEAAQLHDKALLIIALPMFYGLMAFQAVSHICCVVINHREDNNINSWSQRKNQFMAMYDSCFMVADIYEAFALLKFGELTMKVLKKQI